ncbi:calcium-binding protein [Gymnodinialimonas sp.]
MIGILALLAMGIGVSFMLPDGAEDDAQVPDGNLEPDDDFLKHHGSSGSPDQTDLLDFVPPGFDEEFTENAPADLDLEPAVPDLVDLNAEGEEFNQPRASNAPYENDFDLSAFVKVEFAEDIDNNIAGTEGSDLLVGGYSSDLVNGGAGSDFLFGGQGSDTLWGGEGDDLVVAVANPFLGDEAAASELHGGEGNDTLIGENDDLLVGGEGIDFFHVFSGDGEPGAISHIFDFDASTESLLVEIRDDQMGGDLDFDLRQVEAGVEVIVNGIPVVFLEGVEDVSELNIQARSVGY